MWMQCNCLGKFLLQRRERSCKTMSKIFPKEDLSEYEKCVISMTMYTQFMLLNSPINKRIICRSWLFFWQLMSSLKPCNKGESSKMAAFCLLSINLTACLFSKLSSLFCSTSNRKTNKWRLKEWCHVHILTIHYITGSNCQR